MGLFSVYIADLVVFLVEPSSTQANIIRLRLNEAGIRFVQHYSDGSAALLAMRGNPPNIAISAMHLNDMTGADLAVSIRTDEHLQTVAFILVTSIDDAKQLDLVKQAGACAILPKPFSVDEMRFALNNALDYLNLGKLNYSGEIEHIRALIVDDSRSARVFLRHALESMGLVLITEAENGENAVEIIREQQQDIIFTDFNMPKMDGLQLLQYIRNQSWQSSVPVVMISSEQKTENIQAMNATGVSGICDKPFELTRLKSLIESILNEPHN